MVSDSEYMIHVQCGNNSNTFCTAHWLIPTIDDPLLKKLCPYCGSNTWYVSSTNLTKHAYFKIQLRSPGETIGYGTLGDEHRIEIKDL